MSKRNITRVRVELKRKYNDPERNFKDMFQEFKRRVSNAGILHDYKEHQYYESKSSKDRKKRNATIKKYQMENLEQKILAGEQTNASPGMIKKVKASLNKDKRDAKKERKNYRQQYED